jgi:peptidylprolyl isomerase
MTENNKKSKAFALLGTAFVGLFAIVAYNELTKAPAAQAASGEAKTYAACETPAAPEGIETVAMEMELKTGTVEFELRPDLAPKHVERITTLAKEGFYDNVVFHRVIEGFMAQTGDPTGTGMGGSNYDDLPAEFTDTNYQCGTLGMARSQNPNSANSQFFITFEDAEFLNGQYTVFGYVTDGMEHIHQIKKGDPNRNGMVVEPDKIVSFRVKDQ